MANEVRIIGGNFRGRKLTFADLPDLRPTLGRVRETLFNWLRNDIVGSRCLDLFAGSGALGFEALSRGAAHVTFVDRSRRVIGDLRANAETLDVIAQVDLVCARAEDVLRGGRAAGQRVAGPWDIVFLDPPFRADALARTLEALAEGDALAEGALVYVEAPRREPLPLGRWREVRQSTAGDTRFGLLATP